MFYQMASQMPFVDQEQLFRQTAEKMFDMEPYEIDSLIQQQPPINMMGMETGMQGMGGDMVPQDMGATEMLPPEGLNIDAAPIQ